MSTIYNPIIQIIEEEYEMPQLGRSRRISALLPSDYDHNTKRYPVLYLHDGQNLFDESAPYGNWAIDKTLAEMKSKGLGDLIIIAIDHGENDRISEYSPFPNERFGEGQGLLYLRFLLETLKPYVDKNYRTLPDRLNTGIGGSSMGGLISLFAGLARPKTFSKMMVFSPSLWLTNGIFKLASTFDPLPHTKLYIYAGAKESQNHLFNVRWLKQKLKNRAFSRDMLEIKSVINPKGEHSEIYWREAFPKAVEWLF